MQRKHLQRTNKITYFLVKIRKFLALFAARRKTFKIPFPSREAIFRLFMCDVNTKPLSYDVTVDRFSFKTFNTKSIFTEYLIRLVTIKKRQHHITNVCFLFFHLFFINFFRIRKQTLKLVVAIQILYPLHTSIMVVF